MFDMRPVLIDAKKHNLRLFQKTDSHWNYAGGYFCYVNLIERMKKDFPQLNPIPIEKFNVDSVWQNGGDLSRMLGLETKIKENDVRVYPKFKSFVYKGKKQNYNPGNFSVPADYEVIRVNPSVKGPKILVIRDSFCWLLMNYLSENFSKSVYIWDNWEYKLNEEIIAEEKPDAVLTIITECQLKVILDNMSHKSKLKK
jgi:hypothetical protein